MGCTGRYKDIDGRSYIPVYRRCVFLQDCSPPQLVGYNRMVAWSSPRGLRLAREMVAGVRIRPMRGPHIRTGIFILSSWAPRATSRCVGSRDGWTAACSLTGRGRSPRAGSTRLAVVRSASCASPPPPWHNGCVCNASNNVGRAEVYSFFIIRRVRIKTLLF